MNPGNKKLLLYGGLAALVLGILYEANKSANAVASGVQQGVNNVTQGFGKVIEYGTGVVVGAGLGFLVGGPVGAALGGASGLVVADAAVGSNGASTNSSQQTFATADDFLPLPGPGDGM
jgi:hypothetical protein